MSMKVPVNVRLAVLDFTPTLSFWHESMQCLKQSLNAVM